MLGQEVFFNTGTDEHGVKIYRQAQQLELDPQKYCDIQAGEFQKLKRDAQIFAMTVSSARTDPHHIKAAQEFWRRCDEKGHIYKKNYKIKYCVGCELEKTDSELVDGRCPLHPSQELEIIEEENYFFKFSTFSQQLLDLYEKNPKFVLPKGRMTEIKKFVERGLEDFSISRLKSKMPWGIEVPTDPEHVMYVWFDALVNYISALGWPEDEDRFNQWWPAVQIAGKDNLRQQAAMWQAMLMGRGLAEFEEYLYQWIHHG